MKAIGKNIVITPIKENSVKTSGGLLLAEVNREDIRYRMGKVVTVGDAVDVIKKEDMIYYDRHAGFGIELKKEQYKVIKENDVVIII
jgi:co-chaperonin GroES (HSP10)